MRVIGGALRGRRFQVSKAFKGRPTTDFAREALFNVLQHKVELDGMHAVDLFCGTGAVSYELASRGAASVVAVDKQFAHVRQVREQVQLFELNSISVVCADAFQWLKRNPPRAGLVFADPPYALDQLTAIPTAVWESDVLEPKGWLVLEHGPEHRWNKAPGFQETRKYGGVHFSFFQRPESGPTEAVSSDTNPPE